MRVVCYVCSEQSVADLGCRHLKLCFIHGAPCTPPTPFPHPPRPPPSPPPPTHRRSCEQSIADLGCSYLDLLLIHWPHAWVKGTEQEDTSVTLLDTW